ncbi:hypothetical protein EJB05_32389, partial [Eragrostis curvula]
MELLRDNVPMVSLSVTAAALYARFASSRLPPGLPRFAALLPVIAFFAAAPVKKISPISFRYFRKSALSVESGMIYLSAEISKNLKFVQISTKIIFPSVAPLAFSSSILRFVAGFFLGWLGTFKVALLAAGRGPLDPALPVVPFLFIAAFPVKLKGSDGRRPAAASEGPLSRAVEVALLAAILRLYPIIHTLHRYVRYCAYGLHLYCLLNLLLPCTAAAGRALAGMELERQFDRPYLSTSLREFWGRRWNLMVSAILRSAVYDPVRARTCGNAAAAAMATFLVSGVMHEAMASYLLLRPPTGEMVAFFLIHGACCLAEDWCARRWKAKGWPPLPRPVTFLLLLGFMAGTMFWLFFPPICRDGGEEMLLQEWAAVPAFFVGTAQNLLRYFIN